MYLASRYQGCLRGCFLLSSSSTDQKGIVYNLRSHPNKTRGDLEETILVIVPSYAPESNLCIQVLTCMYGLFCAFFFFF